jgi:hypothetical protein
MNEDDIDADYAQMAPIWTRYGINHSPPDTLRGDEARMATSYRASLWNYVVTPLIMVPSAIYLDLKYVVAIGFSLVIITIGEISFRSYCLDVRLRRVSSLLKAIRNHQISN